MTDYEMLSIVIMIITLVASLLINNRDKKKQRRHPALTGGRLNSLKGGEKPITASSLPAVIVSREYRRVNRPALTKTPCECFSAGRLLYAFFSLSGRFRRREAR